MSDVTTLHPLRGADVFEGHSVRACSARLTAVSGLEIEVAHNLDDTVQLLITGTVTGIGHVVEERSGDLIRVHTIKIIESEEVTGE